MVTAFMLICTEIGAENRIFKSLRNINGIKEVHLVKGLYDIIVRLKADAMEDIKNTISWKI